MTTIIKKDQIKSLILATDRNFRGQTVRMFNDVAFPAEKSFAAGPTEVTSIIEHDHLVRNLCIGSDALSLDQLRQLLKQLQSSIKTHGVVTLVYLREDLAGHASDLEKDFADLHFRVLPIKKADFIQVYHSSRSAKASPAKSAPPSPPPAAPSPPPATAAKEASRDPNVQTFFEATQHLRQSIDAANSLAKNPADIAAFTLIGQRFNGVVGTFSFVRAKPGYKQLFELAGWVDDLCRTYQRHPDWQAVQAPHLELVMASVKCAFTILKDLREGRPPTAEQVQESDQIQARFQELPGIERRANSSQDDVDSLIEQLKVG